MAVEGMLEHQNQLDTGIVSNPAVTSRQRIEMAYIIPFTTIVAIMVLCKARTAQYSHGLEATMRTDPIPSQLKPATST